jgi:CheY-like chemotaxis protein/anti-sigma regulatory factor (Ser/Thr protein kinase)
VLARAVEHALPLLEQRGHALRVDVAPGLRAEADPVRLAQVVGNLLTNAARYTPSGGRVSVDARRVDGALVVRVRDDGQGIAPEDQARVFEPFVQLPPEGGERASGGLGIGLALVRSLVELHGGAVEVASDGPGRGSAFTVRLPQRLAEDDGARSASARLAVASRRRVERVLVVDDNADAADTIVEALGDLGYEARAAYTGEAAVRVFDEHRPEVVFLDVGLPGIDGLEVARRLRRAAGGQTVRIVALSGFGQDDDRRACLEAGCDEHMLKPVDLQRLLDRIERT